jgi:predicted phosphoribosyltransferase
VSVFTGERGSVTRYEGREAAGRVLARELRDLERRPCVVAGIPRGGILVAEPIADALGAPLTAVHARKLPSPQAPEVAFGAMDEDGHAVLDYRSVVSLGVGEGEIERTNAAVAREVARRAEWYPGPRLEELLSGRTVVLVDDGLATGLTMQVAVGYALRHGAEGVVVAVPCASERAAYELGSLLKRPGDRFVCPLVDPGFESVGAYYRQFPSVTDEEVERCLSPRPRVAALWTGGAARSG